MSESSLRLVWVYPDLLSTYGDQGNALVVERRARQRRLNVSRIDVRSDQPVPTSGARRARRVWRTADTSSIRAP